MTSTETAPTARMRATAVSPQTHISDQIQVDCGIERGLFVSPVDCILSPWTSWSQCSVSCGLGSLFRQRNILRDARPGGSCGGAQFDSRPCFLQACPGTNRSHGVSVSTARVRG